MTQTKIIFRYFNILHILLNLLPFCGFSQQIGASIGINDGLINNEVTSIIQDKNGFLWFGTRGGLQQYDGYEMKLLKNDIGDGENLKSQSIEVLKNGIDNNIWHSRLRIRSLVDSCLATNLVVGQRTRATGKERKFLRVNP